MQAPGVLASASSSAHQAASHADGVWATVLLVGSLMALLVFAFWWLLHEGPGDDGGGGGGGEGRPPDPPRPSSDGPAWWPEFEREFAAYVAAGRAEGHSRLPALPAR